MTRGEHDVDGHCDPRASASSLSRVRFSGPRPAARASSTPRCSASSRSTPTSGSRRTCHVRPRRHRRCLRGARCPLPRRRSCRPRAYVVGHRSGPTPQLNRHELPGDHAGLGHDRPSADRASFAADDLTAYLRARMGSRAATLSIDIEAVHRLKQPRSGRHPRGAWDVARRPRCRMANDQSSDGRRRPDQPLRDVRRGGPRRRARAIRGTAAHRSRRLENAASRSTSDTSRASRPGTGPQ